jgi:hypothetical protein
LKAILRKTNARNRTQAAIWAIEHGLRDSTLEHNGEMTEQKGETSDLQEEAPDVPSLAAVEPADTRLAHRPIRHSVR